MSKIRESIVTNCERKFLLKALGDFTRLDGRSFDEFRSLKIEFGKDWGLCFVSLGKTRVLAQTSCEIQQPKSSRPSEGILNINLELNPLSAPHFEPGRQSDLSVQLNRLLEKCIKDSKAVDLESLCIKASEKVWALRIDIHVINHEGNILDCASIAMLASIAHFRRPDVTCDGEEFIIHNHQQRDPIPTVILHYPVCITYVIFNGGEFILADPLLTEEGSADASLTIGLNSFKELCGLHLGGNAELLPGVILNIVSKATRRANIVIEEIKEAIKIDNEKRYKKVPLGFHLNRAQEPSSLVSEIISTWDTVEPKTSKKKRNKKNSKPDINTAKLFGKGSAEFRFNFGEKSDKKPESWAIDETPDLIIVEKPTEEIYIHDTDSEEDEVIIINK